MPLERLEEELYKPESSEIKNRNADVPQARKPKEEKVPGWKEEREVVGFGEEREDRFSARLALFKRWLILGVAAITLVLTGIAGFYIYQAFTTSGVTLAVEQDKEVLLGVPFVVSVNYTNNSRTILHDANISVSLPEGLSFFGAPLDQRIDAKNLGDVGVGSEGKEEFKVIALQNSQSAQNINAALDYVASQVGSRFSRQTSSSLFVGEPAIHINVTAPEKVVSGEEFELAISYQNISKDDLRGLELRLIYPPVFHFGKSSIPPSEGDYLWKMGDLRAGSQGSLIIKGSAVGNAGSFFTIQSGLTVAGDGQRYAFPANSAQLSISSSPLSLAITANNQADYVASPGDQLEYVLAYQNNTDTNLRDVVISAQISGEMYEMSGLSTGGFFNNNMLIWNSATTPPLQNLSAGESGVVKFSVPVKSSYPIRRLSDKNFKLHVHATIESPTVPANIVAAKTISVADLETKVKGKIVGEMRAFFRDAASGILNKGTVPPHVNMPTQYTVHWLASNYSNDAENAEMRAFLQSGVTFTGTVKSTITAVPTYNAQTQEVVWDIDKIAATKGVISKPIEATFQIEATPSAVNVGQVMPLVSQAELRAKDSFTGLDLMSVSAPLTTYLPYDTTVAPNQGVVAP